MRVVFPGGEQPTEFPEVLPAGTQVTFEITDAKWVQIELPKPRKKASRYRPPETKGPRAHWTRGR